MLPVRGGGRGPRTVSLGRDQLFGATPDPDNPAIGIVGERIAAAMMPDGSSVSPGSIRAT